MAKAPTADVSSTTGTGLSEVLEAAFSTGAGTHQRRPTVMGAGEGFAGRHGKPLSTWNGLPR